MNSKSLSILLFLTTIFCGFDSIASEKKISSLSQTDKTVDRILAKISKFGAKQEEIEKLKALGTEAVPRILYHLDQKFMSKKQMFSAGSSNQSVSLGGRVKLLNPNRIFALSLLQHVWSDEAFFPVIDILKNDNDQQLRYLALVVLTRNEKEKIFDLFPSLINDLNPQIAGFAFTNLENQNPDLSRMTKMLKRAELWETLYSYLPRYYSPTLTDETLQMLERGKNKLHSAAIESLIQQNANSERTRNLVGKYLNSKTPSVREMAAEYFSWHGASEDISKLDIALKKEKDIYCLSAINAAIASIKRQQKWSPQQNEKRSYTLPDHQTAYMEALKDLENEKPQEGQWKAFMIYKNAEPFEPLWIYKGTPDPAFTQRCADRMKLQSQLFAIPGFLQEKEIADMEKLREVPVVQQLIAPVRNFFNEKRKSFGLYIGADGGPFADSIHVGDDVPVINGNLSSVVAVGDGIVRAVEIKYSWGGFVIIEHRLSDGVKFCSLYAHLSPFIHVSPGQIVKRGQKIACIGRAYTWENGGYQAHLHFGIHMGKFREEGFTGYLTPDLFKSGTHGWVEPQSFIRERIK